jgi:hypothetical protein
MAAPNSAGPSAAPHGPARGDRPNGAVPLLGASSFTTGAVTPVGFGGVAGYERLAMRLRGAA